MIAALAARTDTVLRVCDENAERGLGVAGEAKTNFMRALRDGVVSATTRPLHVGRTIIVLETELTRHDGALVAKTTQTQAFHHHPEGERAG